MKLFFEFLVSLLNKINDAATPMICAFSGFPKILKKIAINCFTPKKKQIKKAN